MFIRIKMLKLILNNSMVIVGKMYNVSDNAIRKWCKSYGLPYKKEDISNCRKELGIEKWNNNINNDMLKKTVAKYDADCHLLQTYSSIEEASRDILNRGESNAKMSTIDNKIRSCCHGRKKTAYGYIWQFA